MWTNSKRNSHDFSDYMYTTWCCEQYSRDTVWFKSLNFSYRQDERVEHEAESGLGGRSGHGGCGGGHGDHHLPEAQPGII